MNKFVLFATVNVFISSLSQILLKSSANEKKENFIKNFLNFKVILAYTIFFGVMFVNSLVVFKHIELSQISIVEALGYIFVPILSYFILKEKLNKTKIYGIFIIVIGVVLYNI
ncbi:MAG: EamA family transporter [Erysipelotrichaceae bacterium]|nr:EamA family transporter [Bacillota bacterium]